MESPNTDSHSANFDRFEITVIILIFLYRRMLSLLPGRLLKADSKLAASPGFLSVAVSTDKGTIDPNTGHCTLTRHFVEFILDQWANLHGIQVDTLDVDSAKELVVGNE